MARYTLRKIDGVTHSPGNQVAVRLPNQNLVAGYVVRLRGDLVVADAGNGAGTFHADAPFRLLRQVNQRSGTADMISVAGTTLGVIERYFGEHTLPQTFGTATAKGSRNAFDVMIPVPNYMPFSYQPEAFAFPSYNSSNPTLTLSFATAAELAFGGDSALSFDGVVVEVYEMNQGGTVAAPGVYSPLLVSSLEIGVGQSITDAKAYLDNLRLQGSTRTELRAVIVEAFSGGAGAAGYRGDDAVLTRVGLNLDGSEVQEMIPAEVLRRFNAADYALSAHTPGVVVLDAAEDRNTGPGELWTLRTGIRPFVQYDAQLRNGENLLRITTLGTAGRIQ